MARKVAFTVLALLLVMLVLGGIKGLQISALAAPGSWPTAWPRSA